MYHLKADEKADDAQLTPRRRNKPHTDKRQKSNSTVDGNSNTEYLAEFKKNM